MIGLDVRADIKQVERMLSEVHKKAIPKATVRALNKTMKPTQKEAIKILAADIGITQKAVRKGLILRRATRTNLRTSVQASGRRIPVAQLKARQLKKGVAYRGEGGVRKLIPGAFIATMSSGHKGVYKRVNTRRLPIDEKFGPSIPHVFVKKAVDKAMLRVAATRWSKIFQHEIDYELRKYR